ncbi:unnamed protein product [Ixodes pacificus]
MFRLLSTDVGHKNTVVHVLAFRFYSQYFRPSVLRLCCCQVVTC